MSDKDRVERKRHGYSSIHVKSLAIISLCSLGFARALYHLFTFHEALPDVYVLTVYKLHTTIYVGWVHKKLMLMKNEEQNATHSLSKSDRQSGIGGDALDARILA